MTVIHNRAVTTFLREKYLLPEVRDFSSFLREKGTFTFSSLPNGLFPAASLRTEAEYTGYSHVWVRDNIYIAYAHYLNGQPEVALKNIGALARYFIRHKWRFELIISGELDFNEPMNRPHIRFNGEDLSEISQKWAHAENDALGYFVWLFCKLINEDLLLIAPEEKELLALFALYFARIRYWEDEDSGHWEEPRKIEASSIGVVVGGLEELELLMRTAEEEFGWQDKVVSYGLLDSLIARGRESLYRILPAECTQSDPAKNRRYDAALLFLIFPVRVVPEDSAMADQILADVTERLKGNYGIRRYPGDSFWSADYKEKLRPEERTIDFSDSISTRDRLLKSGQEAQWCIFDPVISVIHGLRYQKSRQEKDQLLQTYYFNRSIGQLTAEDSPFVGLRCPELYYLEEGRYVPNDTVPLLWTQANLWMAFKFLEASLAVF